MGSSSERLLLTDQNLENTKIPNLSRRTFIKVFGTGLVFQRSSMLKISLAGKTPFSPSELPVAILRKAALSYGPGSELFRSDMEWPRTCPRKSLSSKKFPKTKARTGLRRKDRLTPWPSTAALKRAKRGNDHPFRINQIILTFYQPNPTTLKQR